MRSSLSQILRLLGIDTYDVLNIEVHTEVRTHLSQLLRLLDIGTLDVLNIKVHITVRISLPCQLFWLSTFIHRLLLSGS